MSCRCLLPCLSSLVLTTALAMALGACAIPQKINLNPPHGDVQYQAWSVFAPDLVPGQELQENVIVVFHGFSSAVPNGFYKHVRELFRRTHHVVGINYDYLDPPATAAHLKAFAREQLQGRRVIVLGTSLGGYWANWFAQHIGAHAAGLVNPVVDPATWITKHIGKTKHNPRRDVDFTASAADQREYAVMERIPDTGMRRLVVLTRDDQHLDFTIARDHYQGQAGVHMVLFENGGHTLNLKKHPVRDTIRTFVYQR